MKESLALVCFGPASKWMDSSSLQILCGSHNYVENISECSTNRGGEKLHSVNMKDRTTKDGSNFVASKQLME